MAYDSIPTTEVTARERILILRDFLDALPDERFDIRHIYSQNGAVAEISATTLSAWRHDCGTAACITGWGNLLFPDDLWSAALDGYDYENLIMPELYFWHPERYTRARAVRVLDHYLATGEVSWEACP